MRIESLQAEDFGEQQDLVDVLFATRKTVERLDVIVQAEISDFGEELMEIVQLLPPGTYERQRLCDQLNSALAAHGWGATLGTVE